MGNIYIVYQYMQYCNNCGIVRDVKAVFQKREDAENFARSSENFKVEEQKVF